MSSECFERGQYPISPISVGARFLSGYAFKSQDFGEVGFPVVKIKNIQNRLVSLDDSQCVPKTLITEKLAKFVLKNGDVLIAMTGQGSVGRVGRLQCASHLFPLMNQRVGKFLADETSLNKDYLYYVISSDVFEKKLFAMGSGSGQPNLSPEVILSVEIPFPPYFKQVAIAETLNALDDRITLLRETNATLEAIAQALFKSWFVDFDPVRAKMEGRTPEGMDEATAPLFPDSLEETELGVVPRGWRLLPLAEAMEINPARKLRKGDPANYLDMASVATQGHVVSAIAQREMGSGTKFVNGDTLLARITPCLENGKTAFVDFLAEGETGWGSTEFIVLQPKAPLPEYFAYLLCRHGAFREFAVQSMSGTSGRQRIQNDVLGRYPVAVPTAQIAEAFGQVVSALQRRIAANHASSQTLATLRDTLLPRLISGQLRLPDAETALQEAVA